MNSLQVAHKFNTFFLFISFFFLNNCQSFEKKSEAKYNYGQENVPKIPVPAAADLSQTCKYKTSFEEIIDNQRLIEKFSKIATPIDFILPNFIVKKFTGNNEGTIRDLIHKNAMNCPVQAGMTQNS
ncbi:MAG: hypothetical protein KBD78_13325 [Oligoflexales bacterium]|nr:hypothetical protein [Oligoflexales bacterium]